MQELYPLQECRSYTGRSYTRRRSAGVIHAGVMYAGVLPGAGVQELYRQELYPVPRLAGSVLKIELISRHGNFY